MIQEQTILKVVDNSGAKWAQCIKVLNAKKNVAKEADRIVVTVKSVKSGNKLKQRAKKGTVYHALVVRSTPRFKEHAVILIKSKEKKIRNSGEPIGTRISGPVSSNLYRKGYFRIIAMASDVI